MHTFIDDHVLIIKSDPNFWAKLRFGRKWMRNVTCSIYETKDMQLKSRSGILTLFVSTESVRYPIYVSSKNKKKALKFIYDFKIIKKRSLLQPILTEQPLASKQKNLKTDDAFVIQISVEDKNTSEAGLLESINIGEQEVVLSESNSLSNSLKNLEQPEEVIAEMPDIEGSLETEVLQEE